MNQFKGKTLSWEVKNGVVELTLHREPCNEIGSSSLAELEKFASALPGIGKRSPCTDSAQHFEVRVLRRSRPA